jgi:putative ABC transport system permease protein
MEMILQDLRYAIRTLWKSRAFATVAVVTLALGIGASTAIFSVIENILIAPFPYPDSSRLMSMWIHNTQSSEPGGRAGYSSSEFLDYAAQNHVFDRVTAASEEEVLYKHGEGTERLYGADVTPGTFEFFGLPALYGRVAQPADYEPGAPPVFVMRYKTWVSRFNADLSILNKTLVLNGIPRTLIGIMPPRFAWYEADVLFPTTPKPGAQTASGYSKSWFLLGHLKPGVTVKQAEADLAIIASREAKISPQDYPTRFTVQVRSLTENVTGRFQSMLLTALAGVALLLLIGCGNVANLMLARATGREKEFALRAVLGASRSRLVRQLLLESLLLAIGGAVLGTLIAWASLKSIVALLPQDIIPAESIIRLNTPVLAFTLGVAALTALIFGLAPALQVSRRDLNDPLRDSGKGVSGGGGFRHGRLRDAVVVLEVALSLTLLVGAGLLMRSFVALREEHLGFRPDHVVVVLTPLPQERYKTAPQVAGFFRSLQARLKLLPGVMDVSPASSVPLGGGMGSDVEILGKSHPDKWNTLVQLCGEAYLSALRVELQSGRSFTEAEVNDARKLAVVNQTFVRKYLANENPIGQRIHLLELESFPDPVHDAWFEIVGVATDAKNRGVQQPIEPEAWVPYTITATGARGILVRTAQDPLALLNSVQHEIWATDSGVALSYSATLEQFISSRIYAGPRFAFLLMTIFGSVGLVLVTVGVYSVLAYTTARRTHEIGIRMALGAEGTDVLGLVIKNGLRLVATGVVIGLAASLTLSKLIAAQLWGVSASDPVTLTGAVALLLATGVVACWIPARRASRVDPLVALRYE